MTSEFLQVAASILQERGEPMSARDIVDFATEHKMFSDRIAGKTPFQTMKAKLSVDIRRKGTLSRFVRTAPGRFFLRAEMRREQSEYQAPPFQKPAPTENVLALDRELVLEVIKFQGINRAYKRALKEIFRPEIATYAPRLQAELRDDLKQVLTYILVTRGEQVLCFQRGNYNRVEDYLRGSTCIGFGGHVAEQDFTLFSQGDLGLRDSARRELMEELALPKRDRERLMNGKGLELVGLLNDDSSPVGRRHLAIVFRYEVSDDPYWDRPQKGEKSIAQLHWISPGDSNRIWRFEYWSQLCLREYFPRHARSVSAFQLIRPRRIADASIICVIGSLGSGKTEATRVLKEGFGFQEVNSGRVLARLLDMNPVSHQTREIFQRKALKFIRREDGPRLLAKEIARLATKSPNQRVVLDGLRQRKTFDELAALVGRQSLAVIYVHTSPDIAYSLYSDRARKAISFDEYARLCDAEVERDVIAFLPLADAVIYNALGYTAYLHTVRSMAMNILGQA